MTSLAQLVATSIHHGVSARDTPQVGPFRVLLDATSPNVWRNYAIPDPGAEPSAAEVTALIEFFSSHGRVPRLEYVPDAAPAVEHALLTAGFQVEGRPPLMSCRPGGMRASAAVDGVTIGPAVSKDDLFDTARVQDIAYGSTEPTGPDDAARLAATVGRGGIVMLARDAESGTAVGGGLVNAPIDGLSELAAIGVLESHRRRGIATALVAALTNAAHERGADTVWLEPAGPREQGIYERAGYLPDGEKLWISLPATVS